MQKIFLLLCTILFIANIYAQNSFKFTVKAEYNKSVLQGPTTSVNNRKLTSVTNDEGIASLNNIPNGKQTFKINNSGFEEKNITLSFL